MTTRSTYLAWRNTQRAGAFGPTAIAKLIAIVPMDDKVEYLRQAFIWAYTLRMELRGYAASKEILGGAASAAARQASADICETLRKAFHTAISTAEGYYTAVIYFDELYWKAT